MPHADPHLASLEQQVALAKLHATSLVVARELLAADRSMHPATRAGLMETTVAALALLTTKLAPASTPVIDDAIAKLEHVEGAEHRRANLIEIRDEVRESMKRLHGFVGAPRRRRRTLATAVGAFLGGALGWLVADFIAAAL